MKAEFLVGQPLVSYWFALGNIAFLGADSHLLGIREPDTCVHLAKQESMTRAAADRTRISDFCRPQRCLVYLDHALTLLSQPKGPG